MKKKYWHYYKKMVLVMNRCNKNDIYNNKKNMFILL